MPASTSINFLVGYSNPLSRSLWDHSCLGLACLHNLLTRKWNLLYLLYLLLSWWVLWNLLICDSTNSDEISSGSSISLNRGFNNDDIWLHWLLCLNILLLLWICLYLCLLVTIKLSSYSCCAGHSLRQSSHSSLINTCRDSTTKCSSITLYCSSCLWVIYELCSSTCSVSHHCSIVSVNSACYYTVNHAGCLL